MRSRRVQRSGVLGAERLGEARPRAAIRKLTQWFERYLAGRCRALCDPCAMNCGQRGHYQLYASVLSCARLDSGRGRWHVPISLQNPRTGPHENLLPAVLHLVERPDLRHPALDLALWRVGRPGRVRQPLLPYPRRRDRPDAADGAALGDLQRRGRGVVHPAVVAWTGCTTLVDVPPTGERYQPRPWQKPHRPNLTGTPGAHRPTGSTLAQGRRPKATGDYKAWNPGR